MAESMNEQIAAYIQSGGTRCPMCGAEGSIEGDFVEVNEGKATQDVGCTNCGATWTDCYKLDSITNLNRQDFEPPKSAGMHKVLDTE